jgi:uncharacterized membrane protein YbhN (UPF0104 family)
VTPDDPTDAVPGDRPNDVTDDQLDDLTEEWIDDQDAAAMDDPGRPSTLKIIVRVVLVVAALAFSWFILTSAFDDLDFQEVLDAVWSLTDAEMLALGAMWLLWIGAQGLQTASLIKGLPVRRGVVAFLGPASVASVIPGPSDLPVRYRMLTSWGRDRSDATLAVAAGGLFSVGIKLVLPIVAAVGLVISDAPIEGTLRTVVVISLIAGLGIAILGLVLRSERRTERVGHWLDPLWRAIMRLLRRPDPGHFATHIVEAREKALSTLTGLWLIASWGTILTATARFALLLMALRFTGVGEELVSWPAAFVVFALVQGLTVIPLTAGDAGVSEVAFISLLTAAAGADYVNQVTAAVLVFRMLTWLFIIPIGFGTLVVWRISLRAERRADTT